MIRGPRVEVALLAWQFEVEGRSPDEIAGSFPHLSLAQVHAAIAYYYDHRDEIESLWREEDSAVAETLRRIRATAGASRWDSEAVKEILRRTAGSLRPGDFNHDEP